MTRPDLATSPIDAPLWIPLAPGTPGPGTPGGARPPAALGRKADALAAAASLGLTIPASIVLTRHACEVYFQHGADHPALRQGLREAVAWLQTQTHCTLGGEPGLRLAVRISPQRRTVGLADATLNVGRLVPAGQDDDDTPRDPFDQLIRAITSAWDSWNHPLARRARQAQPLGESAVPVNIGNAVNANVASNANVPADTGMALIVQQMIAEPPRIAARASASSTSSSSRPLRALTRNPATGKPAAVPAAYRKHPRLREAFTHIATKLEHHFADLVEFEYLQSGDDLVILDARIADRDSLANVRIITALAQSKILTPDQAILRVTADDVMHFLLPTFSPAARDRAELLTQGTPASAGVAVGKPAFTAAEAIERASAGEEIILVRKETYPEDIEAVRAAAGILTTSGGMTSHAAVVARGWGKCCIVGAGEIRINPKKRRLHVRGRTFTHDDILSLDGGRGHVIAGPLPMLKHRLSGDLSRLLDWADARRTMKVMANSDTPEDARRARALGAQGIGLCRTEHMFFDSDRIEAMRQMILASTIAARQAALERLLPHQRRDFIDILRAMDGLPVTVRLLDPPLHEFLPHDRPTQAALAKSLKIPLKTVQSRVAQLRESNPMMGHRGCRLSVTYPEILQMQVRAIVEAAIERRRLGGDPQPRIMHPLVSTARELALLRTMTLSAIETAKRHAGFTGALDIPIGTMIEVPRAALLADELAIHADFLSFGTNDLTQLTFGYSRDDAGAFVPQYLEKGVLADDPFESLDITGVGGLITTAVTKARAIKPDMPIAICGEHGGDARSIRFCQQAAMNAVSCSPFRIPVARLAAGQAAV